MVIKTCQVASYLPIDALNPHPMNKELRSITRERLDELKQSLIEKGLYEPLLVWKENNQVLAGNQRLRAVKELIAEGWQFETPGKRINELPVVIEDVTERRALEILHQSNNHHGGWVEERLAEAMREAEEMGLDLKAYGYSAEEIDRLMKASLEEGERLVEAIEAEEDVSAREEESRPDEFDTLTLEAAVMSGLKDVLRQLARAINPHWREGDSLNEAAQALVQAARESDLIGEFK